jgi:short-subunit dehydrogenase
MTTLWPDRKDPTMTKNASSHAQTPDAKDSSGPRRKVAVVTGASSGIGLELTKLLAQDCMDLYLIAEDQEKLESVAAEIRDVYQVTVHALPENLAHADAAQVLGRELEARGVTAIDVLVNDAGIGRWGHFASVPLEDHLRVIAVNLIGLTCLTHRLLPHLVRAQGKVLNLASVAAFQPGPNMAVYYATKAYVLSLSLALAEEFKSLGVSVTALCPGPTDTDFAERAGMEETRAFRSPLVMDAADVAETGYKAMMRGEGMVVAGMRNKVITELERFLPTSLVTKMSKAMLEKTS